MRSLYSGVSGLKVHQTKMDVLGNNIANVNTIGFKSSSVRFSDVFYQTTQSATGPNANTGAGGQNAKQIGLGSAVASITTNITAEGASQRTDQALDMKISGDAFFIVNSGGTNYFTKAGAFQIDAAGNLVTATGASVMGWQVNPDDPTNIATSTVSPLKIMSQENLYASPELTTAAYVTGNIDKLDTDLTGKGEYFQLQFYDNMGASYIAKYNIVQDSNDTSGYYVQLKDITDSNNKSIFLDYTASPLQVKGGNSPNTTVDFAGVKYKPTVNATGDLELVADPAGDNVALKFDSGTGAFAGILKNGIAGNPITVVPSDVAATLVITDPTGRFVPPGKTSGTNPGISVDFSSLTMFEASGSSNLSAFKGDLDGKNAGRMVGDMTGFTVGSDGKIYGKYDNGVERLLGQIAVAKFSNPAGLESVGNSMFATTQNSGEFDGIGQDPTLGGGKVSTGILEMSNVDLSTEFTEMITTQRGFQANSKIITTSDTLLDELINLKR